MNHSPFCTSFIHVILLSIGCVKWSIKKKYLKDGSNFGLSLNTGTRGLVTCFFTLLKNRQYRNIKAELNESIFVGSNI